MSKTISTALKNHLAEECTTLATCWEITRRDGRIFRFTDHDQPLTVLGGRYLSSVGYSRTAIASNATLSVDNLDLEGLFDDDSITEEDLRAGLFDFAEVRIFAVNHQDLSQGIVRQKRGTLGEVASSPDGIFRAELRGLGQRLAQRVGDVYTAECRHDLGDARCRIPIQPDIVQRSQGYEVGDYVRVATGLAGTTDVAVPIVEPSFENIGLAGWSATDGGAQSAGATIAPGPFDGGRWLVGSVQSSYTVEQTVDMVGVTDFSTTLVDTELVTFTGSVYRTTNPNNSADLGRFLVEALDASGALLGPLWDTGYENVSPNVWTRREINGVTLPIGTRQLRFACQGLSADGGVAEAGFDLLSATLVNNNANTQDIYENRIYRCVAAGTTAASQPTYNTLPLAQTTDGTAVFEAEEAWTREAVVASVTDTQLFAITVDENRATSDDTWFADGALFFETGANRGRGGEIKAWVSGTGQVTMFLPFPRTVAVGDKLRLYPGCDKRLDTCINKFSNVLEFGGFPYVPGSDHLASYPDARTG